MKYKRGFTLIELLVVIAIIGLLSSIVTASLNSARVKARDAKRSVDIRQIQIAVELYYDNNGHYPKTFDSGWTGFLGSGYSDVSIVAPDAANLSTALLSYIKSPTDPKPLGGDSGYLYISATGADYCILFWRTPENLKNFGSSLVDFERCPTIDANGQCSNAGGNSIFIGTGVYSGGC